MKCPECNDSTYTDNYENNEKVTGGFDQMWRCLNCGHHWSVFIDQPLEEWLAEDDGEEVELPPELQQQGFYIQTESGNVGHVWGAPNMSQETMSALIELIDAAHKAVENGEIKPDEVIAADAKDDIEDNFDPLDEPDTTCPHCRGTGIDKWTGLEDCEHCDGMGYEWWW